MHSKLNSLSNLFFRISFSSSPSLLNNDITLYPFLHAVIWEFYFTLPPLLSISKNIISFSFSNYLNSPFVTSSSMMLLVILLLLIVMMVIAMVFVVCKKE